MFIEVMGSICMRIVQIIQLFILTQVDLQLKQYVQPGMKNLVRNLKVVNSLLEKNIKSMIDISAFQKDIVILQPKHDRDIK